MILVRLNLKLKLVRVAKFCSSDVTPGVRMPAGDSNTAVSRKRKELERLVSFVSGGTKGKGCLTREGGCHPP